MLVKVLTIMKFDERKILELMNEEGEIVLGSQYTKLFNIGDYVQWRSFSRNENYEETITIYHGIITNLIPVLVGGRDVWYAKVLENGAEQHLVLLSKITKIETN